MLDVEYEILSEFADGVPRDFETSSPVERAAFEHLISAGWLERVVVTPDNNVGHFLRAWCITASGCLALEARNDSVNQNRQQANPQIVEEKPKQRKAVAVLKWIAGILAATIAAVIAGLLLRYL